MDASSTIVPEIILHDWQAVTDLNVEQITKFLGDTFGTDVSALRSNSGIVRAGAGGPTESCKITDIKRPFSRARPDTSTPSEMPPLYDGHEILRAASAITGPGASLHGTLHIIFTDMLICTYDDDDARYHARPIVASNPSLISTSSMIWGPARSQQYYKDIMICTRTKGDESEIEARHASDHLTRGDVRMQQVAEGYAMQAVFYAMTRQAFCNVPECRLYNAHWQSEMISAQMRAKLCDAHQRILDGLT